MIHTGKKTFIVKTGYAGFYTECAIFLAELCAFLHF